MPSKQLEETLATWRDAQRRLDKAVNGILEVLEGKVEREQSPFQRLSADHMMERIDALSEVESRCEEAKPSTSPVH